MYNAGDEHRGTLPGSQAEDRRPPLHGFEEAEQWDLEYWQSLPPASRLSALVAIRADIEKVHKSREGRG